MAPTNQPTGLLPSRTRVGPLGMRVAFSLRARRRGSTIRRHTWLPRQATATRVHRPISPASTAPLEEDRRASGRTRRKGSRHSKVSQVSRGSSPVRSPKADNHRPPAATSRARARAATWVAGRNRARRPRGWDSNRKARDRKTRDQIVRTNRRTLAAPRPLTNVQRAMTTRTMTSRQGAPAEMPVQPSAPNSN